MCYVNCVQEKNPGPTTYQHSVVTPVKPAYQPFNSSASRVGSGIKQVLHNITEIIINGCYSNNNNQRIVQGESYHNDQHDIGHCRPGHYQHDVVTNRHVDVMGSFGGTATLKEAIVIKCTNGIRDHVSRNRLLCNV